MGGRTRPAGIEPRRPLHRVFIGASPCRARVRTHEREAISAAEWARPGPAPGPRCRRGRSGASHFHGPRRLSVRRPGGARRPRALRRRRSDVRVAVHLPALCGGGHGAAGAGPGMAGRRAVDRGVGRRDGGVRGRRPSGTGPAVARVAGRRRDRRCAGSGAGLAEPHVRAGERDPDAGRPGRPARPGPTLVGTAPRGGGRHQAHATGLRRPARAGRPSYPGRPGAPGLRRHRGARVRGDARGLLVVLDRRAGGLRPGRPLAAGAQPVAPRRTHATARRAATDRALARRHRADRPRDPCGRCPDLAPW